MADDDETEVEVPFGEDAGETATLLLAAAEDLELDPGVVRTGTGVFLAPPDVVKKAGVKTSDDDDKPTKKAAAKK